MSTSANTLKHTADNSFLGSKSKMADLVRSFDWSATNLGPIENWPQSLRTTVNIILNSPVPMVVLWGKHGVMIYNDAYAEFAGARHPQLLGSKVVDGWPEVADFNRNVMKHGLAGEQLSYKDQQLVLHRHGEAEDVWMDLNYSPVADETGKPAGVLAIVVETTERVLAEKNQRDAETRVLAEREKLQRLFNDAPAYIAVLHGPEHVFTMANTLYKKIVGNRDIIGKTIRQALPEIKSTGLFEVLDSVYETGKPFIGSEIPIGLDRKGKGKIEIGYFNFVYQPVTNEDDKSTDIFVHAVEITPQITANQKLAETKRMFDALFDSTVVAIAMADLSGHILQANKTFLKLFGYNRKEFDCGLTSHQISADDSSHITENIYKSLKSTGESDPVPKTYKRKNGKEFPALVGAAMLPGSEDQFMAIILDTSEITKLRKLNRVKDEFIALASHQLRTPATAVKQYLGILLEGYAGELTAEQQKYLSTADNANNRQLNIINDLLKTAQIDADDFHLDIQSCDLNELITEAIHHYEPVLEARNQTVEFVVSQPQTIVQIDRVEMAICITNLIENASKYSQNDTKIEIEIVSEKSQVKIIVRDHGVGISKADQPKIFNKFTRISNELSDTVDGNGLGLYTVKRIIDLHKGKITVQSAKGKGTSFVIRLPI